MTPWLPVILFLTSSFTLQAAERARDLGVPLEGTTGRWNAITDVTGVGVGYQTLISGEGNAAIRTGVTAIWPRGKDVAAPVFGGWFSLNGNGEMTVLPGSKRVVYSADQ